MPQLLDYLSQHEATRERRLIQQCRHTAEKECFRPLKGLYGKELF